MLQSAEVSVQEVAKRGVGQAVSVARGVDPQRVLELLKSVAANHQSIAKEPAPQAYIVTSHPVL
jgi:small-conductance mechanosensitive channel